MPFALLVIGLILLISAVRGTHLYVLQLMRQDFTGPGNFMYWVLAIIVIGVIGYIEAFKRVSDALVVLIIVSLFLTKGNPAMPGGGIWKQLTAGLATSTSNTSLGVTTPVGTVSV